MEKNVAVKVNKSDFENDVKRVYRAHCTLNHGGIPCKYSPYTAKVMNLAELRNSRINFNESINRCVTPNHVYNLLNTIKESDNTRNFTVEVNTDTNTVLDGQHTLCAYILGVEGGWISDNGLTVTFKQVGTGKVERDYVSKINSQRKDWNLYDNLSSERNMNHNIMNFMNDVVDPFFSNSGATVNLDFANTKGKMSHNDNAVRLAFVLGHGEIVPVLNKKNYAKNLTSWTNENYMILRKQWTNLVRMWKFCDKLHKMVYGISKLNKSLAPRPTGSLESFINQWKNSIFTDATKI